MSMTSSLSISSPRTTSLLSTPASTGTRLTTSRGAVMVSRIPTTPICLDNKIMIRLTADNYLYWRTQVDPILRTNLLFGFVDGSLPVPRPRSSIMRPPKPLPPDEFNTFLIAGLDIEYDALRVEACRSEAGLDIHHANLSSRSGGGRAPSCQQEQPQQYFAPAPAPNDGRQQGYSGRQQGQQDRSTGTGGTRPTCQICGKQGHLASRCFKRYYKNYLSIGNDGGNKERQLAVFSTTTTGSTSSFPVDPAWYADTGATDHLTNDLNNLTMREQYHGKDNVKTVNGTDTRHVWLPRDLNNATDWIIYEDTFSLVDKPTTIRLLLSMALSQRWHVRQLDIQNVFLHGVLEEEVFMRQPPGFEDPVLATCVDWIRLSMGLNKPLVPGMLDSVLFSLALGLLPLQLIHLCLFCGVPVYLLVYVDDIILVSSSTTAADRLVAQLGASFALKDLGPLHYFLGVEVYSKGPGLLLSQRKYATELLHRAGLHKCTPVSSPMVSTDKLSITDGSPLSAEDSTRYRSIVGGLQYLMMTRPDLSFAINKVCQYLHAPRCNHWSAVKRILRYVKATLSHGLLLSPYSTTVAPLLSAFSDADWASNVDDRRSTGVLPYSMEVTSSHGLLGSKLPFPAPVQSLNTIMLLLRLFG
ncbi:hypothetical protein QYE76_063427 [Lolium multiflorum]|uniref:CCHC-type domain-containing protein n=1 Tax=Lolium multiflorum TaxID=4521 RepID=A0AAD8S4Y9_LOLMU|nr:hypothetical protein QYE76_063427 [Lolium multiflorum]